MARILDIALYDAYQQFAGTIVDLRPVMTRAYLAAVDSSNRSNAALKESLQLQFGELAHEVVGLPAVEMDPEERAQRVRDLDLLALSEDRNSDWQASVVILFAHDALKRFSRQLLGKALGMASGYGPLYNGVPLTTMLQAGAHAVRHISDWDDNPALSFPYDEKRIRKNRGAREAYRSIKVFQSVFGKGVYERFRQLQSWPVLCQMDGLYGTHRPDYARVERAIVTAASDIAAEKSQAAVAALTKAISIRETRMQRVPPAPCET